MPNGKKERDNIKMIIWLTVENRKQKLLLKTSIHRMIKSIGMLFTAYILTGKREKQIKEKERNYPILIYYSSSSHTSNHLHSYLAGAKMLLLRE